MWNYFQSCFQPQKTQKPFLNILVRNRLKYGDELNDYFHETIRVMFGQNQHRETISVLRSIINIVNPAKSKRNKFRVI